MRVARVLSIAAVACLVGCAPHTCGWDDAISRSDNYRITLVEPYRPGTTTTALYSAAEDLQIASMLPSCGAFDEVTTGAVFDIHRLSASHLTADTCSIWNIEIASPTIASNGAALDQLNVRPNSMRDGLFRDFGGGCTATWELSIHAPGNDPFVTQRADALPVVLAYRVLKASIGSEAAACARLLGLTVSPSSAFLCGDAFVATMVTR